MSKKRIVDQVRHSGHYVDQKLHREDSEYRFNISLDPKEDRLMNVLLKELQDESETTQTSSAAFYQGNMLELKGPVRLKGQLRAPVLKINKIAMYQGYLGHENPSGKERRIVDQVLSRLCRKQFPLKYNRRRPDGKTDRIETDEPLIKRYECRPGLDDKDLRKLDNGNLLAHTSTLVLYFNPIFIDQIATKYILMPSDINQRMTKAAGGAQRVTIAMNNLRDLALREISAKRYRFEIKEPNLISMLGLEIQRKERVDYNLHQAIAVNKKIGLIVEHSVVPSKNNNTKKHVFVWAKGFK